MTNILIRKVPEAVVAAIDANAARVGLSRSEYLRRSLAREQRPTQSVSKTDLAEFCETFKDLGDETFMDQAWS